MPKRPPIQPFEARVCHLPIFDKVTDKICGMTKDPKYIKVQLPGEHFNYSLQHGTWTRHRPAAVVTNRTGTNVLRTDSRVSKFRNDDDLRKKLGHAKIGEQFLTYAVVKLRNSVLTKNMKSLKN